MFEREVMERALRAYFRSSRGTPRPQPSSALSEVVTVAGRTEIHLRNGPDGLLARYIVGWRRIGEHGYVTKRLRSAPISEAA